MAEIVGLMIDDPYEEANRRYAKACAVASIERDGTIWLLDNATDAIRKEMKALNIAFIPDLRVFRFGWRTPVSRSSSQDLREDLFEFPFGYEILWQTPHGALVRHVAREGDSKTLAG